jgi:hypothetical protein
VHGGAKRPQLRGPKMKLELDPHNVGDGSAPMAKPPQAEAVYETKEVLSRSVFTFEAFSLFEKLGMTQNVASVLVPMRI